MISRTGHSDTPFLYDGHDGVMTDGNGLYYMRARYYSPLLMRFINSDTLDGSINDSRTLNHYAYADGNPESFIDPEGHFITVAIGAGIGALIGIGVDVASQYFSNNRSWNNFSWGEVGVNALSGAASGALAGTVAGLPAVIAANAGFGGATYFGTQLVNHQKVELSKLGLSIGMGAISGFIGGRGMLYGKTGETVNAWLASAARAKYLNEGARKIVANGDEIANDEISSMLIKAGIPNIIRSFFGDTTNGLLNYIGGAMDNKQDHTSTVSK